jgi:agmatine/peptidylarginine deiminase
MKMINLILTGLFLTLSMGSEYIQEELPIGFTPSEWENRHIIHDMGYRTDPPPGPVRNIAEYEPMQGVLIRYPFGISTSLISEMSQDVIIYCLVSSSQQNSAYNSMNSGNVNMENVEFILGSTDSYWTRDYGPWWVVDGNGDMGIVDFTYNRPRPNDNNAPYKVSEHLDVPYYSADFISTGGNYMTDGTGISASTQIAYTENSQCGTNDQSSIPLPPCSYVDNVLIDYYGINTYHVVADPNDEYIDHIDCWGKYLSPTRMLIREVSASHPQYQEIEAVAEYFENTLTSTGEEWEVFRVYTPNDQPYTNSLILNNKVFVPVMNSQWDDDALEVYQAAMPDHEVLGFTGSWQSTDALHCRVKGIPDLTYTAYADGDVNMDESIDVLDVVMLVNFVLGAVEPTSTQIQIGDFNDDGILNILDVISLVNQITG